MKAYFIDYLGFQYFDMTFFILFISYKNGNDIFV